LLPLPDAGFTAPVAPVLLRAPRKAALRDPAVSAARGYEMLMIAVLAYRMVTKPF